jgi:hypothetical protein
LTTRLITAGELMQAPTAIDWNTLAEDAGSADARQALEQGFLIDSVSSWVGEYCGMPLGLHASSQTEQAPIDRAGKFPAKALVDGDGNLHFWADTLPVVSVTSGQWAYLTTNMAYTPIVPGAALPNVSGASWVLWGKYPHQREIEIFDQNYEALKHQRAIVQLTYVSGWANAQVVNGTYAAGSNVVFVVDSTLGMTVGQTLYLFDNAVSETVTVVSIGDATHVTVANTANTHTVTSASAVTLSAIPYEVKLATIWACAGLARVRGSQAYEMRTDSAGAVAKAGGEQELIELAEYLLGPYKIEF